MNLAGLFPIAGGVFFLIGAISDWDWLMKTSWPLVKLIKREGLRAYYIIIGLFFIGIGIYVLFLID